jgi:hypothetical protein
VLLKASSYGKVSCIELPLEDVKERELVGVKLKL